MLAPHWPQKCSPTRLGVPQSGQFCSRLWPQLVQKRRVAALTCWHAPQLIVAVSAGGSPVMASGPKARGCSARLRAVVGNPRRRPSRARRTHRMTVPRRSPFAPLPERACPVSGVVIQRREGGGFGKGSPRTADAVRVCSDDRSLLPRRRGTDHAIIGSFREPNSRGLLAFGVPGARLPCFSEGAAKSLPPTQTGVYR